MSIKKRLISTLGLELIIMIGICAFSIFMLSKVNDYSTVISNEMILELNGAQDLNLNIAKYRSTEFKHIVLSNDDDMTNAEKQMDKYQVLIDKKLNEMKAEGYFGVDNIIVKWNDYKKSHVEFVKISRSMDSERSFALLMGDMKSHFDSISAFAQKNVKLQNQDIISESKSGDKDFKKSSFILIGTCIISLVICIVLGALLLKAILRPLKKFQNELDTLALSGGDLTRKVDVTSKDEMGDMANALNAFLQNLREIIIDVNKNANVVMES